MKAILLAGGKGTRLAPYTTILPKPLMPIDDQPILEIVIRQLVHAGFGEITLAVGHLAELIAAYFGDGSKWGVQLAYSREETPLGTAGPIALVPGIQDTFVVMNGDVLTSLDYGTLLSYHRKRGAIATLVAYTRSEKIDLGVLESDEHGWLRDYVEKPTYQYNVSAGIYVFEPSILSYIPCGQRLDLPELVLKLVGQGEKVNIFKFDGYWLDIGHPEDYVKAVQEFQANRKKFLPDDQ
jgi:NDP-sugar pyrophosphorylase family protein